MINKVSKEPVLNLDRMVRSATAGSAGEPYCQIIVDCLWQLPGFKALSVDGIWGFWDEAAKSDLTVREFIEQKQREFA